jgi:hypothetical protein
VVLLDERGWSQSTILSFGDRESPARGERLSPWQGVTQENIEETARTVVGPDGAYGAHTQAEMDEGHWSYLAATLDEQGVAVDATDLRALPHEVELSDRLLARLGSPLD